jgi:hypothetical protein
VAHDLLKAKCCILLVALKHSDILRMPSMTSSFIAKWGASSNTIAAALWIGFCSGIMFSTRSPKSIVYTTRNNGFGTWIYARTHLTTLDKKCFKHRACHHGSETTISTPEILHEEAPSNHHITDLKEKEGKIPRSRVCLDILVSTSIYTC